jgi:type VI secretion system secreted protein VgrG
LRIVTDASGNVIKTLDYDSFGNIIQDTNPSFDMPLGFAGELLDTDTGLVRFGFREYSPEIGRWTAKDPILFLGGDPDVYGYCLNDPINLIDPLGLFNPTKGLAALVNAANAGRLYAAGSLKLAASAGFDITGAGVPAGIGTALWGAWNIKGALAAQNRGLCQWNEAFNEDWSDASWKNLLGVLPFGNRYDDPNEPSFKEFWLDNNINKLKNLWKFLGELGTLAP